jgi:truncated hemoglobin YjbI
MSRTTPLYDQLGGRPVIEATVRHLHGHLQQDPQLRHFFDPGRTEDLIQRQCEYFADMLGGPPSETAPDLAAAHAGVTIEDHHVTLVVGHLRASLLEAGVDELLAERVVAVAARLWYASRW